MQRIHISLLAFCTLCMSEFVIAQGNPDKPDSNRVYRNIESYSKRHKLAKLLYPLIFSADTTIQPPVKSKKGAYKSLIQKSYRPFEGKIIRSINIQTLDPFGKSIRDTATINHNYLLRAGNTLHIKSLHLTIRNFLLFKENQVFDSLLVRESERLVRKNGFVHDVLFTVSPVSKNSDSVDIFIREMDKWSIIPKIGISSSKASLNVLDKNFAGLGHELQIGYSWNHSIGAYAYNANYFISNIRNTYTNATFHFDSDENRSYIRNITIDRPFFSAFAKWAAGMNFSQQFRSDSILLADQKYIQQDYKFNTQDYWGGFALQIFKGNSEEVRTTNFITTMRYLRIRYLNRPTEFLDPKRVYANEDFFLAGIGVVTRKYFQDKYIFKYGTTEDVPVGQVVGLTIGHQIRNNEIRQYVGVRFALGNYYSWGYLSSSYEYGTFIRGSKPEQGIISAGITYFTGLMEIGNWKMRQFIKPSFTFGLNRFSHDSLTLKDGYGLDGFNSSGLSGTHRMILTIQTQFYAPWSVLGFRFGPYLTYSAAILGAQSNGFNNSRIYSQIGIGVLMLNEKLVFNTFQISIAFYPLIPGNGRDVFKVNTFKTSDFGFRDFIIGKPDYIAFQ